MVSFHLHLSEDLSHLRSALRAIEIPCQAALKESAQKTHILQSEAGKAELSA